MMLNKTCTSNCVFGRLSCGVRCVLVTWCLSSTGFSSSCTAITSDIIQSSCIGIGDSCVWFAAWIKHDSLSMIQHRGPYQSEIDSRCEGDGRGLDIYSVAHPAPGSSSLVAYDTHDNAVCDYLRSFKQITKPEGNVLDIERRKRGLKPESSPFPSLAMP